MGGFLRKHSRLQLTNDKTLFDTLNSVRCDGNHVHTHLVGGAETEASGHYTTQMARLIHKGWKNSVETRAKDVAMPTVGIAAAARFPSSSPVPAMPCVVTAQQEHREKNIGMDTFFGALIAKSLTKKEMMANSDAYKALKDEAEKLSNPKRPVWLMDSVTERWKVKE